MSDEGEKTCPLCAEEMDLTDQQLKPCKCGYEICVWCWHHIMDMAEKDETEGRCPACRTPYNKEKVVGMASKCKRLVAEMSMEKKLKTQNAKTKTTEGRKQLSSVRVIQRNLVYIVGLPLNLADEELLQRREYFGQYGKVLKVSLSRTAAGAIQNFANNTCSVYITYLKEEEAVRCIQSVHGFVLEGRPLRACFGTTKYCHAWLRNVPCSNPDCLYLHEVGLQEDSFTKDEIISAYTRSRVQQITGATNSMQRHAGNMLPPPADDYNHSSSASSGKPMSKSALNNTISNARGPPPNSSSGHSIAPLGSASWGPRPSSNQPSSASLALPNGPIKQKPETINGSVAFSTAVAATTQIQSYGEDGKNLIPKEGGLTILHKGKSEPLESVRQYVNTDWRPTTSGTPTTVLPAMSTNSRLHSSMECEVKHGSMELIATNSVDLSECSYGSAPQKELNVSSKGKIRNICSSTSSMGISKNLGDENSVDMWLDGSRSDDTTTMAPRDLGLQQYHNKQSTEPLTSVTMGNGADFADNIHVTRVQLVHKVNSVAKEHFDTISDSRTQVENSDSHVVYDKVEEDLWHFENQRLKDPEVSRTNGFLSSSHVFHLPNHPRDQAQQSEHCESINYKLDAQVLDKKADKAPLSHPSGVSVVRNGYPEILLNRTVDSDQAIGHSYLLPSEVNIMRMQRTEAQLAYIDQNGVVDMGESNIISNILSMDFDAWDSSLTSPQNLAKLFRESDKHQGTLKVSSSCKGQNTSQSRFSFARQQDPRYEASHLEPSPSSTGRPLSDHLLSHEFPVTRDINFANLGGCNGFSTADFRDSDIFSSSYPHLTSISRAQTSAPPGFSAPSRAPPPGFVSHERMEWSFDPMSGNHLPGVSSLVGNSYQAPPTGNAGSVVDIEFLDPAILAVGKGRLPGGLHNGSGLDMRTNFPSRMSAFENDARLHLLMQRSLSPLQNRGLAEMGDAFSTLNDAYRIPSQMMDQTLGSDRTPFSQMTLQQSRTALVSNGQWDSWNEVPSRNDLGMAEVLRTERLGFNKFYNSYEDSKFRMPSSGNLYDGSYGI